MALAGRTATLPDTEGGHQHATRHRPCTEDHDHTPECYLYGFHDVRRAFATENASGVSAVELQALMRHKSFATTQKYINMAKQLQGGTEAKLFVPPVLRRAARNG